MISNKHARAVGCRHAQLDHAIMAQKRDGFQAHILWQRCADEMRYAIASSWKMPRTPVRRLISPLFPRAVVERALA